MLDLLYEDNHLLVVNKPVGQATQGATPGRASLFVAAGQYVKTKYQKPGNVYLGIVSRLDSLVSGVVVIARTSKAAARLNDQFREGTVRKVYWALVAPPLGVASGRWRDWMRKNERRQRMEIVPRCPDAREAVLAYQTRGTHAGWEWLEIELITGRKHQIRAQCAHHGAPILGDTKYGSPLPFPRGIGLHARSLFIKHPTRGQLLEFTAPLPRAWRQIGPPNDWPW